MTLDDLHQAIWSALEALAGDKLSVYDGYVPDTPATNYAVLWMTPGQAMSTRVGWKATDRADRFQITVASSNSNRACLATADLIRAAFTGLRLGDGPNAPRCKEDGGPGPFPPDTNIPGDQRWWMPMPYRLVTSI